MSAPKPKVPAPSRAPGIVAQSLVVGVAVLLVAWAWTADRGWFELHLTDDFCSESMKQIHRWTALRVLAIATALAIVAFVRPRVGRWATKRGGREALAASARNLLAVLLALAACDLGLRAKARFHPPPPIPPAPLPPLEPDPVLGWVSRSPSTTVMDVEGHPVTYAIDRDGMRAEAASDHIDPSAPSILFAGESITEGIGVERDESYPALVEHDLGVKAVAAAVHGYGDDQIHVLAMKTLARLAHPLAVVTIVIPKLLDRDLSPTRSRLVLDGHGGFETVKPLPQWWLSSPVRKIARSLAPYHDASAIALARALFIATAKEANRRGAYPLFLLTEWGEPCLLGDERTPSMHERLFSGTGLHYIYVRSEPALLDRSTFHPRAAQHRLFANAIEAALREALPSLPR